MDTPVEVVVITDDTEEFETSEAGGRGDGVEDEAVMVADMAEEREKAVEEEENVVGMEAVDDV